MPVILTGSSATALYLKDNQPTITRQAREMWNQYSGAPGLLDAVTSSNSNRRGYVYRPVSGTYVRADNGMKVTDKQLRAYVKNVSDAASLKMKKNTQQLIAGIILYAAWYEEMQSIMAALYNTIWVLSIGGFTFEDDTQRNLFYAFVLMQFNYMDNFYYQLEHGIQPLDGSALSRAGMYGQWGNGMWQNVGLEQEIRAGKTEARRVLGPNENHCHDSAGRPGCLELASLGWIPIDRMIPIGDATCYSNCLCHIIYR